MRRVYLDRSYRAAVMATNPVAYWRLGESSGTVAIDEMGKNNGTYVNAPTLGVAGLSAGEPNTAVTLNGTNQSVTFAGINLTASDATFLIWGNPSLAGAPFLFGSVTGALGLYIGSGNKVFLTCPNVADAASMTNAIVSGTSVQIAVTYIHNGAVAYYRNGALENTTGAFAPAFVGGALTNTLGAFAGGQFLTGCVDEPAIWNRALSGSEISRLYAVGRGF